MRYHRRALRGIRRSTSGVVVSVMMALLVICLLAYTSRISSSRRRMPSLRDPRASMASAPPGLYRLDERLRRRSVYEPAPLLSVSLKAKRTAAANAVDFFVNNGYSRALRTAAAMGEFSELANATFLAYQGPHEDPYAAVYDHRLQKWIGPVRIGTSSLGRIPDPVLSVLPSSPRNSPMAPGNNRGPPTLVIDSMGYLHVSFGGDGGDKRLAKARDSSVLGKSSEPFRGDYGSGRQTHAKSRRPYDVREWTIVKTSGRSGGDPAEPAGSSLSPLGSECQFVKVPRARPSELRPDSGSPGSASAAVNTSNSRALVATAVDLYHFCRHGYQAADITVQRSSDDGSTWTPPLSIFRTRERRTGLAAVHQESSDANNLTVTRIIRDGWSCRFRSGVGAAAHTIGGLCTYRKHAVPPSAPPGPVPSRRTNKDLSRSLDLVQREISAPSLNLYYLELDTRTQQWRNVRGHVLNDDLPLDKERADGLVWALDTERQPKHSDNGEIGRRGTLLPTRNVRPVSLALARPGYPHLLLQAPAFSSSTTGRGEEGSGHREKNRRRARKLWYVGWTGHSWTEPVLVAGQASTAEGDSDEEGDDSYQEEDEDGDIAAEPVDGEYGSPTSRENLVVTMSATNRTHSTVRTVTSHDHGASWRAESARRGDAGEQQRGAWMSIRLHHGRLVPSSYVFGSRSGARIMAYLEEPAVSRTYAGSAAVSSSFLAAVSVYRKLYLIGPDGPVPRARTDAEVCRGVVMSSGDGSMCVSLS